mmetsp:Transcript_33445/g.77126  ORF Transcript_33445/g.77126 Transcript_33445/m.77126 type:complete len:226 (-) Transcript_33445:141-818(-)
MEAKLGMSFLSSFFCKAEDFKKERGIGSISERVRPPKDHRGEDDDEDAEDADDDTSVSNCVVLSSMTRSIRSTHVEEGGDEPDGEDLEVFFAGLALAAFAEPPCLFFRSFFLGVSSVPLSPSSSSSPSFVRWNPTFLTSRFEDNAPSAITYRRLPRTFAPVSAENRLHGNTNPGRTALRRDRGRGRIWTLGVGDIDDPSVGRRMGECRKWRRRNTAAVMGDGTTR